MTDINTKNYLNNGDTETLDELLERLGPNGEKLLSKDEIQIIKATKKITIGRRTIDFTVDERNTYTYLMGGYDNKPAFVLKNNHELLKMTKSLAWNEIAWYKFNEEEAEVVCSNVKEVSKNHYYYITEDGDYCSIYGYKENIKASKFFDKNDDYFIGQDGALYRGGGKVFDNASDVEDTIYYNTVHWILTKDGKLYEDTDDLIAENVKSIKLIGYTVYYLSNNNELYSTINNTLISENVKEYVNFGSTPYYLTQDGKLYEWYNNTTTKKAENVKELSNDYYVTNDNKLCEIYSGKVIVNNFKEWYNGTKLVNKSSYDCYYYDLDNKLYKNPMIYIPDDCEKISGYYYISSDKKIYYLSSSTTQELKGENVKDFVNGGACYINYDNEVYNIWNGKKIAENVKEFYGNAYKTNDDEIYIQFSGPIPCP